MPIKRMLSHLLVILLMTTPILAQGTSMEAEEWLPIPDISQAAFDQALAEDRLMLRTVNFELSVPVDTLSAEAKRYDQTIGALGGDGFIGEDLPEGMDALPLSAAQLYAASQYLSLSPDGTHLLAVTGGIPVVLALDGSLFRVIAPDADMLPDYFMQQYQKRLQIIEDAAVTWSHDGRYIALAFPRRVLEMMTYAANIILIDVEQGTACAVDKMLEQQATVTGMTMPKGGIPVHAAFSQDGQHLLYDIFAARQEGERLSEIRSLDLTTREVQVMAAYNASMTAIDGILADTPQGILHSVLDIKASGPRGLVFHSDKGERTILCDPQDATQAQFVPVLLQVQGDTGLMRTLLSMPGPAVLQPFSVSMADESALRSALGIDPQQAAPQRLVSVELSKQDRKSANNPFAPLLMPDNGVLSPDGNWLLMAAEQPEGQGRVLYVCNLNNRVCGRVDMDAPEGVAVGRYMAPAARLRGLRWADNNRLLIEVDGAYRLFELTITEP